MPLDRSFDPLTARSPAEPREYSDSLAGPDDGVVREATGEDAAALLVLPRAA